MDKPRTFGSYNRRKNIILTLVGITASAIAYVGCPPPEVKFVNTPMELKERINIGFDPDKFARIDVYDGSQRLCSIISTTAVRNYFDDPPRQYVERTRINKEVCKVPDNATTLDLVVSFPYKPEQTSVDHSMYSCTPFRAQGARWQSNCEVLADKTSKDVYFLGYEDAQTSNRPQGHERRADRIDIRITR